MRVFKQQIVDKVSRQKANGYGKLIQRNHLAAVTGNGNFANINRCNNGNHANADATNDAIYHKPGQRCGYCAAN